MQKLLFNYSWNKQNHKKCQMWFIFIELSEIANSFVNIRLVREIESFPSLVKTRFYWNRGCIKMRKHAETFHANKSYKFAIVVFLSTSSFSK